MIPQAFGPTGVLLTDVTATLDEIRESMLVTGAGLRASEWHVQQRLELVNNLQIVVEKFKQAGGVAEIYVDGSFVEEKDSPSDIDGYFILTDDRDWISGAFQKRIALLDEPGVWSWDKNDRRRCQSFVEKPPFWCRYRVELYPDLGLPSDIMGPDGRFLPYSEAFRQRTDTMEPKGIIRLQF